MNIVGTFGSQPLDYGCCYPWLGDEAIAPMAPTGAALYCPE